MSKLKLLKGRYELKIKMKKSVKIKPYDPNFLIYFQEEKEFLSKHLEEGVEIHHIGSTAVPGLGGKNVLDILLLAQNRRKVPKIIRILKKVGYSYKRGAGDRYRIFFSRDRFFGKRKVHIHLHLMWKTCTRYKRYLEFRDYLRKHPEEAKRYYSLKKMWAKKADDTHRYSEMKTEYIEEVLKKAKIEKN